MLVLILCSQTIRLLCLRMKTQKMEHLMWNVHAAGDELCRDSS